MSPHDLSECTIHKDSIGASMQDGYQASCVIVGRVWAYFYVSDEHGEPQLKGEYAGMLELYNTAPKITPKPNPFLQLGNLASISPTYDGWQPQEVGQWDDSWTSCFARLLKGLWELDAKMNGNWTELDTAMETTLAEVIPRLVGILERDGRSIKPCLIHGDLWESNIGTGARTGNIYIFDAAVYYAHNEMEIGIWRVNHHEMKDGGYRQEYAEQYKKSEPTEEWDDRLKLYGVKTKLMYSAGVSDGVKIRQEALEDLQDLIAKYGGEHIDLTKKHSANYTAADSIAANSTAANSTAANATAANATAATSIHH
ncbi:hypothetical protein V500_03272 [Pseudogymnoascus sp. VKM F-4518 (FW-2643)]|nr:hypothetical protein V500_03272 [Pseudogymnoascus sp. VKM F-4518 (FW-2643)]